MGKEGKKAPRMSDLFGVWHFLCRLFVHFGGSCLLPLPLFFPLLVHICQHRQSHRPQKPLLLLTIWIWKPNYLKWESYTIINFIPSSFLFMSVCHSFVATVWLENSIFAFFVCVWHVGVCVCVCAWMWGWNTKVLVAFTFLVRHFASGSKLTILVTHNQINRSELCIPWIYRIVSCMHISENLLLDTVVFPCVILYRKPGIQRRRRKKTTTNYGIAKWFTAQISLMLLFSFFSISVLIGVAVDILYHRKPAGIYLM